MDVDADDFLFWQVGFGLQIGATHADGDADRDGDGDGDDFLLWQAGFGTGVPTTAQGGGAAAPERPVRAWACSNDATRTSGRSNLAAEDRSLFQNELLDRTSILDDALVSELAMSRVAARRILVHGRSVKV